MNLNSSGRAKNEGIGKIWLALGSKRKHPKKYEVSESFFFAEKNGTCRSTFLYRHVFKS